MTRIRRIPLALALALAIALVHGLLYVVIVPPWDHYDEPAHFEYAALIAKHGTLPQIDALDLDLRRAIAESMERTGFYKTHGKLPDIVLPDGEHLPTIGYSQLSDPPLYYMLASVPIRIFQTNTVETQLRGARLISVLLFLVVVVCAWGLARESVPYGHVLRTLLPIAVALMPTLADLMSSVSNDAIAIASVSMFAWAGARFVTHRRWEGKWKTAVWMSVAAASTLVAKNTALIALPVLVMALALGSARGHMRRVVWLGFGVAAIALVLIGFAWGDPAGWYRNSAQDTALRCTNDTCGTGQTGGQSAFQMRLEATRPAPALVQVLSKDAVQRMQGQDIAIGAYVWSDTEDVQVQMPSALFFAYGAFVPTRAQSTVTATRQPTWHTFTATLPAGTAFASVFLSPVADGATAAKTATVQYSHVTLVAGDNLITPTGTSDTSNNLVRNGSAETTWPWMRTALQRLVLRVFPDDMQFNFLFVPLDPPVAQSYFLFATTYTFETFWARFAWGNVAPPAVIFIGVLLFCIASVLLIALTWPGWRGWLTPTHAVVLGTLCVLAWAFTLLRGTPWVQVTPFLSAARYGFPAIVPTLGLVWMGWAEFAQGLPSGKPRLLAMLSIVALMGSWAIFCLMIVAGAARG